jgi:N-methylhydantoinase B
MSGAQSRTVDPITLEVVRRSLIAISNEVSLVIAKTAYSPTINEARDLAGMVYDAQGQLVAQGETNIPGLVGLTLLTLPEVAKQIGFEKMRPGDVYMVSDPYIASTHANDVFLIRPVFCRNERIGFIATCAHWNDVGGRAPGSMNPLAVSCYEEGLRIPPITIIKEGLLQQDLWSLILLNMRQPWERQGDFNAQLAALSAGEARMIALAETYGTALLAEAMQGVLDYSERVIRSAFAELTDGEYVTEDAVDADLATGDPLNVRLTLTIRDDSAVFDFSASDGPASSGVNCSLPATVSAVFVGLAAVLRPMPMNSGVMRAIELKVVEGSLLWAVPPVPVSAMAPTTMECVIAVAMRGLSLANPERGAGGPHGIVNTVFSGVDDRTGVSREFISYAWGFGGMGAIRGKDGASCVSSPMASQAQNIPAEIQERRYPVIYRACRMETDSGGPGEWRGGLAQVNVLEFSRTDGFISSMGIRGKYGPPGIFDGEAGGLGYLKFGADSDPERSMFCAQRPVKLGQQILIRPAGGGGYGNPFERDPEAVLRDVVDEYVSIEGASRDYGVVIKEINRDRLQFEIDLVETEKLRAEHARMVEEVN